MLTERKANTTVISTHSKNYETVAIILETRYCFLLKFICLLFDESNQFENKYFSTINPGYVVFLFQGINLNQYVKNPLPPARAGVNKQFRNYTW